MPPHRPNYSIDAPPLILPSPLPQPPRKVKPRAPTPSTPVASKKRPAPDDIEEIDAPTAKRSKTAAEPAASAVPFTPSKKRRLEEDGLIMLDDAEETIEEEQDPDVIEID